MLNLFAVVLIIFIVLLLLFFKERSFRKLTNKGYLYAAKLNKNNKFLSSKNSFLYTHAEKKSSIFYKNSQRKKCLDFFRVIQKTN